MFGLAQRERAQKARGRGQVSRTASIPAPTGGWNARDNIANMPATDAVSLINWFPTPTDVRIRQGYTKWATGFAAPVETLMTWAGDGSSKLIAASGTAFYDASAGGAIGASVVSGLSNARWTYTMFTTSGGVRYLVAMNGTDKPRIFDGTTWTAVDGVSTPAITGITSTKLVYPVVHKNRLWAINKNTMEVWYSPVGGFGGFTLFDLRSVAKRGGYLVAIDTWTIDGGYGIDDMLVAITSQGECIVYRGTDPSSASTWSLAGVWSFSAPIVQRCLYKFGGDLLLLTCDGLFPLSKALQSTRVDIHSAMTDKIVFAIANTANAFFNTFGWQIMLVPTENCVLVNVPTSDTTVFEQYVMSTITGAWTRFQGWNASCWEFNAQNLYFGGQTYVGLAFTGYKDDTLQISTDLQQAYNYFGARGTLKQWTMARPIIASDGNLGIAYGLNIDFDDTAALGSPSSVTTTAAKWDSGVWDTGIWGGGLSIQKQWQYVSGVGYCAAFRMQTASSGVQGQLSSVDYVYELGGVL